MTRPRKPAKKTVVKARAKRTSTKSAKPARRPKTARSANDAASGDVAVSAYIAALPAWQKVIVQHFDALVVRTVPGVQRVIKWGLPFYGVPGRGWFVSAGGFTKSVKITFFQGVSLKPTPPVGTHSRLRGIELGAADHFDAARIASWVRQAAKLPGFGS